MLIKIGLALVLAIIAITALGTAASYNNKPAPNAGLASGGGNLVPVW